MPLERKQTYANLPGEADATFPWATTVTWPPTVELAIGRVNETDGAAAVIWIVPAAKVADCLPADWATIFTV